MLTSLSPVWNAIYVVLGLVLLWRQLTVLQRLHELHEERQREEETGSFSIIRRAPYSAQVSTMLFAFGAVVQISLYLLLPVLRDEHGMSAQLLLVVHVRNLSFIGGALASATHKRQIYLKGPQERGKPPSSGKANGRGHAAEPWSLPSGSRPSTRETQIHRQEFKAEPIGG